MNQRNETLSFKAEGALAEQLRSIATTEERPLSWVIRKAVKFYVESTKNNKPAAASIVQRDTANGFVLSN